MKITKLYQQDRYLKNWTARITSVRASDETTGQFTLTLDRTAFFPEGGGQSCDTGTIETPHGKFTVIDVQEDGENVIHTVKPADDSGTPELSTDTEVTCSLDWDRRFDNMQRHCGEHILSGIFFSLFGGVNRGFHMGHDYMTIDISLEEKPEITEITYQDALRAELEANRVIWSDAPVTVLRFDSREEAEKMPLRKALAFDEDISIVCVGSVENASDYVACCGTHPDTAGQVGLIKIYKIEKYKGMFRIYFEAGQRALADYDIKHDMLTDLSNRYSSSVEDFPSKLKAQEEKTAALKDELFHLKKAYIENECTRLDAILDGTDATGRTDEDLTGAGSTNTGNAGSTDANVVVYPLEHLSLDDAFSMGKHYMGKTGRLIMLYAKKNTSYILVSDGSIKCGALVKEYASFYNGKGGGNDTSARAIFSNADDAALFADLIRKHLMP